MTKEILTVLTRVLPLVCNVLQGELGRSTMAHAHAKSSHCHQNAKEIVFVSAHRKCLHFSVPSKVRCGKLMVCQNGPMLCTHRQEYKNEFNDMKNKVVESWGQKFGGHKAGD